MNQKLYIPEISDQIILTEDWTFVLYPEHRNEDLAKFFGYYMGHHRQETPYQVTYGWIPEIILPKMRDIDYNVNYPSREDPKFKSTNGFGTIFGSGQRFDDDKFYEARKEAELANPEYVQYYKDVAEWQSKVKDALVPELTITIPKDTLLQVDRIYIRKGSSDYSSITFYAKNLGEIESKVSAWSSRPTKKIKKKALRFWAKLSDCNRITFKS